MEDTLENRRRSLEHLAQTIDSRASELDGVLQGFARLIDDSLSTAETRARDASSGLADEVANATRAIQEQFGTLRQVSDDERERTARALRQTYEDALAEMTALLKNASDGLGTVAHDMRGMTVAIQSELETTRDEVRRGLSQMPKETEENTSAIRRVVSEQIRALNTLSEIASRQGGAHDVVEPRQADYAYANEQPRNPRQEVVRERAEGPAPRREAPARPRRAEEPSANGGDGGWLTGLLARASDGEQIPPAQRRPASPADARREQSAHRAVRTQLGALDNLAHDIDRLIDDQAMLEVWERYRRGERNVFSRRLYTQAGAQAFEDLRGRYGQSREFRQTVDRYIGDFERLLDEVSRNERDPSVARSYLSSETGKVYTLLAHAAGRFDERV
jgi:hypothetical protein